MRIIIIGGGPAGLYFSILMKKADPSHHVTVIERDGPNDTFGWGIVFSDQTFSYLANSDKESFATILGACEIWDNVDVVHRGQKVSIRGNHFSGIGRLAFLNILQKRAAELGVELRFKTNIAELDKIGAYDLLVGADGANSLTRKTYSEFFLPSVEPRRNRYIWLGTHRLFDGLTLTFRENSAGLFIAHSYKFSKTTSTFIVECDEQTWNAAGLEQKSEDETCQYLAEVFKDDLQGNELLANGFIRWLNFPLVKNAHWSHGNIVLIGDALHTAHLSIGSGTKLSLEDAIALFECLTQAEDVRTALARFEETRRPIVEKYQEAAYSSLLWFENAKQDMGLDPIALAYKLMTRSRRIDFEKLKQRDPEFAAAWQAFSQTNEAPETDGTNDSGSAGGN